MKVNWKKIWNVGLGTEKRSTAPTDSNTFYPFGDSLMFGVLQNQNSAMNISAVYRAVEIISDSVAMLPIKVRQTDNGKKEEIEQHPLNYIFKDNLISKYNLIKLLIQSVLLKGNGFAYIRRAKDGTATELQYLESGDVQIHYSKQKKELFYTCNIISAKKIEPCNMIHLVKNSYDGVNGLSVISYAARSIKLANSTENSASSFFTNGCNLSGVLTVQGQLSDKQRNDIRSSWNQAYSNGGNGLAILQGNMEYKPIQLNAADSQLLESRLFNVQDIARFFGISPVLLGDLSHTSYNSIEATQNQFLLHTLNPYIIMCEEEFTRKLLKPSESNLSIDFDETALLKTDKTALASYYGSLLDKGVLSINEVRKELGYNNIEGGDKHIIAYSKIEDNTIETNKEGDINNE
jgi:HK97 family phage portal protein